VEASSGEVVRHRLSLAGKTVTSTMPCTWVAICQARSDVRGGAYYRKKLAEGKSRKEALRCLKRRILRCGLQEPHGRSGRVFVQCRLSKRSLEWVFS
jgi:hypothetical protein